MDSERILSYMNELYPNAHCELIHHNAFELLIAVSLSAQTTDDSVNKVTPGLFEAFKTPKELSEASIKDIEKYIRKIGLYHNKAINIKMCSQQLVDHFNSEVPSGMKELTSLAGVGRKTANVVRSVWFNIPSMPVDTHVERISKRLGYAKFYDNVEKVEAKLKKKIKREEWNHAHHLFIFFGRYHCKAINPECENCQLHDICKKDKFDKYKKNLTSIKK